MACMVLSNPHRSVLMRNCTFMPTTFHLLPIFHLSPTDWCSYTIHVQQPCRWLYYGYCMHVCIHEISYCVFTKLVRQCNVYKFYMYLHLPFYYNHMLSYNYGIFLTINIVNYQSICVSHENIVNIYIVHYYISSSSWICMGGITWMGQI